MTADRAVMMGRASTLVLAAVLLQVGAAADVTIFGVRPELALLAATAAATAGGPERGVVAGFGIGLLYDLYLQSPLGLTALVYAMVGYLVGTFQLRVRGQSRTLRVLCVAAGTAGGIAVWVTLAQLLDQTSAPALSVVRVVVVAAVLNGGLALAATWLWRWAFAPMAPSRVAV